VEGTVARARNRPRGRQLVPRGYPAGEHPAGKDPAGVSPEAHSVPRHTSRQAQGEKVGPSREPAAGSSSPSTELQTELAACSSAQLHLKDALHC